MLDSINGFAQNKDISFKFGADTKKQNKNSKVNSALDKLNSTIAKNTKKDTAKVILVAKGEAGYQPSFDIDGDGVVTLEEFNQYCSENGVSEEDKLKLISVIQNAKMVEKLQEEAKKAKEAQQKEADEKEAEPINESINEKGKNIYAKRGDRKYDERMDENKDSIVTYEEYQKYCENLKSKEDEASKEAVDSESNMQTPKEKEAQKAYLEAQNQNGSENGFENEPEISVEVEA